MKNRNKGKVKQQKPAVSVNTKRKKGQSLVLKNNNFFRGLIVCLGSTRFSSKKVEK